MLRATPLILYTLLKALLSIAYVTFGCMSFQVISRNYMVVTLTGQKVNTGKTELLSVCRAGFQ